VAESEELWSLIESVAGIHRDPKSEDELVAIDLVWSSRDSAMLLDAGSSVRELMEILLRWLQTEDG
jgi:hypothetical protein